MISLVNQENQVIPPRPSLTKGMVKSGVLSAIHCCYLRCIADEADLAVKTKLADDISDLYYPNIDAYDLTKLMEIRGWSVGAQFVDDMDSVCSYIQEILHREERSWAKVSKPKAPLPLKSKILTGVICGISPHMPASYIVADNNAPNSVKRVVKFEEAIPLLSVGDVVEPVLPEYQLRSGAESYAMAVVVSESPLVLVSIKADMRWESTVSAHMFRVVGEADEVVLSGCMARL